MTNNRKSKRKDEAKVIVPTVYRNSPGWGSLYACFPKYDYPAGDLQRNCPQVLEDLEGKAIADIGCGFGSSVINEMKKRVGNKAKFVHIDSDPKVFDVDLARETLGDKSRELYDRSKDKHVVADVCQIPLPDNSFDIIHYHYMFSDNPDLRCQTSLALAEMDRLLRVGGYLVEGGSGPISDWDYEVLRKAKWEDESQLRSRERMVKHGYYPFERYEFLAVKGNGHSPSVRVARKVK